MFLVIYDVAGQPVRRLAVRGLNPTGLNQVWWEERTDAGCPVTSGVYWVAAADQALRLGRILRLR